VLSALGHRGIEELFVGSKKYEAEEASKSVRKNIYNLMYLYTKALSNVEEGNLRNHISYWLVMSALIEKDLMTDIDSYCLEEAEQDGSEAFFLVENSLKLLIKYLRKLYTFHNEVIFVFYF
jgi:hypothetical protein